MLGKISWSSPVTNRLLLEANVGLGPYFWWGSEQKNSCDSTLIQVQDDGGAIPGINYRAAFWSGTRDIRRSTKGRRRMSPGRTRRSSASAITRTTRRSPRTTTTIRSSKYNFNAPPPGYPLPPVERHGAYQLTMYADHASQQNQHQGIFAMYAQDRWTLGRLSLQGGLRFEYLRDWFNEQQMGPNVFVPTALVFPGTVRSVRRT